MKRHALVLIIGTAALVLNSGCASVRMRTGSNLAEDRKELGIYPGAKVDVWGISERFFTIFRLFFILDLPLSAAVDTVLLPADAFQILTRCHEKPPDPPDRGKCAPTPEHKSVEQKEERP